MQPQNLDTVALAFITCAIWCESDPQYNEANGSPEDVSLESAGFTSDDIHPDSLKAIFEDVASYLTTATQECPDWPTYWTPEQFGHDLWLTRNGHGTGFWDRYSIGRGAEIGNRLSDLCRHQDVYVYVGDDNMVHFQF